ncbi:MAG: helix-turn-helix transcriptional regulator [Bacteroidota bacterium]|nr:helix-turn-helix transcriptional regulator [Bacteroidota bacterium]
MFAKEELVKMPDYWMENVQNEIYHALKAYMKTKKINQTELAKELGFTKSYVSQVLHGNFNHSVYKLIELALAIGKAPEIKFINLQDYIYKMENNFEGKVIQMNSISIDSSKVSHYQGEKCSGLI